MNISENIERADKSVAQLKREIDQLVKLSNAQTIMNNPSMDILLATAATSIGISKLLTPSEFCCVKDIFSNAIKREAELINRRLDQKLKD